MCRPTGAASPLQTCSGATRGDPGARLEALRRKVKRRDGKQRAWSQMAVLSRRRVRSGPARHRRRSARARRARSEALGGPRVSHRRPRVRQEDARADRRRQGRPHPRARAPRRGEVVVRDAQGSRGAGREEARARALSINVATEEGALLLASAKQILKDLGKKGAKSICVEDTEDTAKIFGKTRFNGDGVLRRRRPRTRPRPGRSRT